MPCRDYYDDHPEAYYGPQLANKDAEIEQLKKRIAFTESALCGILRAADAQEADSFKLGNLWRYINFPDAGITPEELKSWRVKHEAADKKARKAAAAAEEKKRKEDKIKKEADEVAAKLKTELHPDVLKAIKNQL